MGFWERFNDLVSQVDRDLEPLMPKKTAPQALPPKRTESPPDGSPWEDLSVLKGFNPVEADYFTPSRPGSWQSYRQINARDLFESLRPFGAEERRSLEQAAAELENLERETGPACEAAVAARRHEVAITTAALSARSKIADLDLQEARSRAKAVEGDLKRAPEWAELKAQLSCAFQEAAHQQAVRVRSIAGEILSAME